MIIFLFISGFIFFSGLLVFSSKRKHLLLMLLSLEFIVLSLYFNIFLFLSGYGYDYFFSIIFITIRVCEGALGLSIMVTIIRSWGNDYILTFSSL